MDRIEATEKAVEESFGWVKMVLPVEWHSLVRQAMATAYTKGRVDLLNEQIGMMWEKPAVEGSMAVKS